MEEFPLDFTAHHLFVKETSSAMKKLREQIVKHTEEGIYSVFIPNYEERFVKKLNEELKSRNIELQFMEKVDGTKYNYECLLKTGLNECLKENNVEQCKEKTVAFLKAMEKLAGLATDAVPVEGSVYRICLVIEEPKTTS